MRDALRQSFRAFQSDQPRARNKDSCIPADRFFQRKSVVKRQKRKFVLNRFQPLEPRNERGRARRDAKLVVFNFLTVVKLDRFVFRVY